MGNSGHFLSPRMRHVEQIHFVGIGGAGMCGIAEVLHNEGYRITGSDLNDTWVTGHLREVGVHITIGHHADNIAGANAVVSSTAIDSTNIEILAAKKQGIPIIPRAAMLAELMRFRYGIAVAGTHGKTTTTSLVSCLLAEGGLDPSYVIGGKLNSSGSNAQLGKSSYLVVEADESDASFLYLKPMIAVVTNIDADHMSTYNDSFDKLRSTFIEFLHHLPFYGLAMVCGEDKEINKILPEIARPVLTYGFNEQAHYRAVNWTQAELTSEFTVIRPAPYKPLSIQFHLPGYHNVLNALAAIGIASELGVSDEAIIQGLKKFQGVGRRFQLLGERSFSKGQALIIDDYGHHPQEITATLNALRKVWPDRRLVHVFQPHRFTRTQSLLPQFIDALSQADHLLLMDIYSAGEPPIANITSQYLLGEIKAKGSLQNGNLVSEETLVAILDEAVVGNSVILMQGAGSIGQVAINLAQVEREAVC